MDRVNNTLLAIAGCFMLTTVVFVLLWNGERHKPTEDSLLVKRLRADSAETAHLLEDRAADLVALRDSMEVLRSVRQSRRPVYIRVDGSIHTLTGAPVDSLFGILDRQPGTER